MKNRLLVPMLLFFILGSAAVSNMDFLSNTFKSYFYILAMVFLGSTTLLYFYGKVKILRK